MITTPCKTIGGSLDLPMFFQRTKSSNRTSHRLVKSTQLHHFLCVRSDTRWATWVLCLRGNVVHVVALVAAVRRLSRQLLFADLLPAGMTRDDERSIWCLGQANPQTFYLFTFKTRSCLTSKSFYWPFFGPPAPPLTKFAPKLPASHLLEAFSRWLRSLGAAAVVVGPVLGGTRGWRWSCSGYQTPEATTVAGQHISGSRWDSPFSCTNGGLTVGNGSKSAHIQEAECGHVPFCNCMLALACEFTLCKE